MKVVYKLHNKHYVYRFNLLTNVSSTNHSKQCHIYQRLYLSSKISKAVRQAYGKPSSWISSSWYTFHILYISHKDGTNVACHDTVLQYTLNLYNKQHMQKVQSRHNTISHYNNFTMTHNFRRYVIIKYYIYATQHAEVWLATNGHEKWWLQKCKALCTLYNLENQPSDVGNVDKVFWTTCKDIYYDISILTGRA